MIMAGAVRVAGRPVRRPGLPLGTGVALEASVRLESLGRERSPDVDPVSTVRILYEDHALIAVDKPPGLPTVPTADPRRAHLVGLVKALLARREGGLIPRDSEPYVGIHQRLDRDTSGIVLFTRDRAANKGLAAAFAAHTVQKTYRALTHRPAQVSAGSWTVENHLGEAVKGQGPRMASVRTGGLLARTEFTVHAAFPGGLLVEARPRTGRKHQIRVHLAEEGLPILGDILYGADAGTAPRAMLHAARIAFVHPLSGIEIVIESPDPPDFQQVLEGLPSRERKRRGHQRRPPSV
jgi:RluA family pseudouridine synthase